MTLIVSENKIIEAIYPQDKCYITLSIIAVVNIVKSVYSTVWIEQTRCLSVVSLTSCGNLACQMTVTNGKLPIRVQSFLWVGDVIVHLVHILGPIKHLNTT